MVELIQARYIEAGLFVCNNWLGFSVFDKIIDRDKCNQSQRSRVSLASGRRPFYFLHSRDGSKISQLVRRELS